MDYYKGKRVLVAGSAGFVGSSLVDALVRAGAVVRGTLHRNESFEKNKKCEYVKLNLENFQDCLEASKGIEFVFMCAANSSGAGVIQKTPLTHLTPNILMNSQMLAASHENKVRRFCFLSSNTVYPVTDFPVKEHDFNGLFFEKYFIVGWMKRFSEIMCEMYSTKIENPMECLVVRPGNLYGPRDKFKNSESKVIAALIRRSFERCNPFEVWGDGSDLKDFLYIDDFINGLLLLFAQTTQFDIYNIAYGKSVSLTEIIKEVLKISNNQNAIIKYDISKPAMIPVRLIDISKIQKIINWTPQIDIKSGLKKTYDWYAQKYSKFDPEGNIYDNQ